MKKLVSLLAVFLALAAFVYFYEIQGEKKREEIRQTIRRNQQRRRFTRLAEMLQ